MTHTPFDERRSTFDNNVYHTSLTTMIVNVLCLNASHRLEILCLYLNLDI